MDQTLTQNPPSIDQQIDFVRGARHLVSKEHGGLIEFNSDNYAMLRAIEENLIAVRLFNKVNAKMTDTSGVSLVFGVGKAIDELVSSLEQLKAKLRTLHDECRISSSLPMIDWNTYEQSNPDMIRINELISKYKEVSNG